MKTLTIISHTEHYLRADGTLVGLGSTVTEINHLLEVFDSIIHVAMFHKTTAPNNALPYSSDKIRFVAMPEVGGKKIIDKLALIRMAPKILQVVSENVSKSSYFQFRAPTGIGVFVIPYLILFRSKKGWFKYAGNWKQLNAPLAYRFQKWLLMRESRIVTINGAWKAQPKHCLSFENPCLTQNEIQQGKTIRADKSLTFPINFCFVGRLEAAKGVDTIIEAIAGLSGDFKKKIGSIAMVGTGEKLPEYKEKCNELKLPIEFLGVLSKSQVHDIYKKSHAILLPSLSEGFPKVIAEAMNYGCVPIVSDVSSISQYVKNRKNGFLLKNINVNGLTEALENFLELTDAEFKKMIQSDDLGIEKFSYDHYNERIKTEIL